MEVVIELEEKRQDVSIIAGKRGRSYIVVRHRIRFATVPCFSWSKATLHGINVRSKSTHNIFGKALTKVRAKKLLYILLKSSSLQFRHLE